MVAILAVSVGIAGWIVSGGASRVSDAVEVLQQIRLRKLPAFWGERDSEAWYLERDAAGRPIGWSLHRRQAVRGGYRGFRILRTGQALSRESWEIDLAAQTGRYEAGVSAVSRRPGRSDLVLDQLSSTTIRLEGGKVQVVHDDLQKGRGKASGEAPENYVPEGLSSLVFYLVAAGGRPCDFAMIFNENAFNQGGVRFSTVRVTPDGPRSVRVALGSGGEADEVHYFDREGQPMQRKEVSRRSVRDRVDFETVERLFPDARRYAPPPPEGTDDPNAAAATRSSAAAMRRPA